MDIVEWKIVTFEAGSGHKPVDAFVKKQQPQGRAKVIHSIRLLEQYGNMLGLPHSKALSGGLYEMRIRGKEELRIFYCFLPGKTICLLHGFKKQTQHTPKKELEIATSRMKELTEK